MPSEYSATSKIDEAYSVGKINAYTSTIKRSTQTITKFHTEDFRTYTTAQGLSENFVISICQDKKGLMWFGTFDGLNKFDGFQFKVFKNNPEDPYSIPTGNISDIVEDDNENLWLIINNSAGRFDPFSEKFYKVHFDTHPSNEFTNIILLSKDYLLLCGINSFILDKRNMTAREIKIYNYDSSLKNNMGINIFFDSLSYNRNKYYGINSTRCNWLAGTNKFYAVEDLFSKPRFAWDGKGRKWVYVMKGPSDYSYWNLPGEPANIFRKTGSCNLFDIIEDKDGNIWAASSKGLLYMQKDAECFEALGNINKNLGYTCISVFIDRNNILWIATRGKGIIQYDLNKKPFNHLIHDKRNTQGLFSDIILGIYPYKNKLLIKHDFGTPEISVFNIKTQDIEIKKENEIPEIKQIKNFEDNILKYGDKNNAYFNWLYKNRNEDYIKRFANYIPVYDNTLINLTSGIAHGKTSYPVFLNGTTDYNMCYWQSDTLWIGTSLSGLIALSHKSQTYKRYVHHNNDPHSISSNTIMGFLFDPSGNLWIATTSGLDYFNKKSNRFTHYTKANGLSDNTIYSLTYDHHGKIWIGTGKGLSCLDTATKKFYNFYQSDGLVNTEYNRWSAITASDGIIYMGGMDGIDYFNPADISFSADTLNPVITEVRVNNKPVDFRKNLQLKASENNLSVFLTTSNITKAGIASYAYQLRRSDTTWIPLEYSHQLQLASLAPGNYTLKIRAANQRGDWNEKFAVCNFIIFPYWYQTYWFKGLVFVLLSAIIFIITRLYIRQKIQKQKTALEKQYAIQQERSRISTELHDDLGSGLSTIRILSELNNAANMQLSGNNYRKISMHSKELLQKMNEIVWALNISNDTLDNLISYLREQSAIILTEAHILYSFNISEQLPGLSIGGIKRRHVFLLVKEALHNITKHAGASYVEIEIGVTEYLEIMIQDNGRGIPSECIKTSKGNGISNMQKHAEAVGGTLSIENGEGTKIKMVVELKKLCLEDVV
ncbi:MAG: hypothetical protein JST21_13755 [Bacteroidetes bacterium]|nr:hypothetical protein [Bacteroidota bacterium]